MLQVSFALRSVYTYEPCQHVVVFWDGVDRNTLCSTILSPLFIFLKLSAVLCTIRRPFFLSSIGPDAILATYRVK